MGKIAVVGSNMVDLITYVTRFPEAGETIESPSFEIGCGGKGANQAIAAAKLGSDVMMVTKVGDDLFADNTIHNFQSFGINTDFVEKVPEASSGVAPIFVDPTGENRILIVKGANSNLAPSDIDKAADALRQCDLILMQLEVSLDVVYHTIEFGAKNAIQTLLNPAPADPTLSLDRIKDVTFFTPNETELALLTGMPVDTQPQVEAAAKLLISKGIKTVVVTLGSRGALLVSDQVVEHIPPVKVTPVDTTGAGDAFIGSFAHFYTQTKDIHFALNTATRYAADSITKRGTQKSYASIEEFNSILKK